MVKSEGKGDGEAALGSEPGWKRFWGCGDVEPFLIEMPAYKAPSAANVAQTVINGVNRKTAQGRIFMPAFGDGYSDDDIAAVANYVTARFGSKASQITEQDVAALRKQTSE